MKDKVIIVTGGAKGIGEGIVKVLAKEGAIPVIVGRNQEDNQKTAAAVIASGEEQSKLLQNFLIRRPASRS